MGNFKELMVWKQGMELTIKNYGISRNEPFCKDFGLCDQIRRASVSIPSNIAEGDERGTQKESIRFFNIAKGSTAEVITQLNIAYQIGYISEQELNTLEGMAEKIRASLRKLINIRTKTINFKPKPK